MVIFPLAPDQTIAQMWSNGARWGPIKCNKQTARKQCRDILGINSCGFPRGFHWKL